MDEDRYFGIYRGVVVDNADPLGKGRLKVIVPQVLGEGVTNWAWPVLGALPQHRFPYGTFTTTTTQVPAATSTPYVITHENTEDANRVFAEGSKIFVEQPGDYFIQYSTTFSSGSSSAKTVDIWFRLNGQDIPRSSTKFIISGNPNQRNTTKGGVLDLNAGDYVEIAYATNSTDVAIVADPATGVHPASPGSVFTIFMVGKFTPEPEEGVWVTFEGGDPNFPLWIGAF